jgi:hypothetical protein
LWPKPNGAELHRPLFALFRDWSRLGHSDDQRTRSYSCAKRQTHLFHRRKLIAREIRKPEADFGCGRTKDSFSKRVHASGTINSHEVPPITTSKDEPLII